MLLLRHIVLKFLNDDLDHCRSKAETNRSSAFHLAVINGLDTASHDLGDISSRVKSKYDTGNLDAGHIYLHDRKQNVVEEQQLNYHRRSSEDPYIEGAEAVQYPREYLVLRDNAHGRDKGSDKETDYKTRDGDDGCVLLAFKDLGVAFVFYKYFPKTIEFLSETSHFSYLLIFI